MSDDQRREGLTDSQVELLRNPDNGSLENMRPLWEAGLVLPSNWTEIDEFGDPVDPHDWRRTPAGDTLLATVKAHTATAVKAERERVIERIDWILGLTKTGDVIGAPQALKDFRDELATSRREGEPFTDLDKRLGPYDESGWRESKIEIPDVDLPQRGGLIRSAEPAVPDGDILHFKDEGERGSDDSELTAGLSPSPVVPDGEGLYRPGDTHEDVGIPTRGLWDGRSPDPLTPWELELVNTAYSQGFTAGEKRDDETDRAEGYSKPRTTAQTASESPDPSYSKESSKDYPADSDAAEIIEAICALCEVYTAEGIALVLRQPDQIVATAKRVNPDFYAERITADAPIEDEGSPEITVANERGMIKWPNGHTSFADPALAVIIAANANEAIIAAYGEGNTAGERKLDKLRDFMRVIGTQVTDGRDPDGKEFDVVDLAIITIQAEIDRLNSPAAQTITAGPRNRNYPRCGNTGRHWDGSAGTEACDGCVDCDPVGFVKRINLEWASTWAAQKYGPQEN